MNIHTTGRPDGVDNKLSLLYVISFIVCNVSVCNMQNLLHGKVRPNSLFFAISTASSELLSYCVRKGPAEFCRTSGLVPL